MQSQSSTCFSIFRGVVVCGFFNPGGLFWFFLLCFPVVSFIQNCCRRMTNLAHLTHCLGLREQGARSRAGCPPGCAGAMLPSAGTPTPPAPTAPRAPSPPPSLQPLLSSCFSSSAGPQKASPHRSLPRLVITPWNDLMVSSDCKIRCIVFFSPQRH